MNRLTQRPSCTSASLLLAFCLFALAPLAPAQATAGPAALTVKTAGGGFILGYDIDHNGTTGYLAEAKSLSDGKFNIAVETFDQATGQVTRVVKQQADSKNSFAALGIYGGGIGIVEFDKVHKLFVDERLFGLLNPVGSQRLNGQWTPPLTVKQPILGIGGDQSSSTVAVMASQNFSTFLFSSDLAANTFGPNIGLQDSVFGFNDSPVIGLNTVTNQAVVASSTGGILTQPTLAIVDLATGDVNQFTGLGFGFVNGIAIDSQNNLACTTTEVDFSVEFYDLATQTGFKVFMPNAVSQAQAGIAVAFDDVHKLFLVQQALSSTAASGSSIQVFDEQGNLVESINGLSLPTSPTRIAINPSTRTGFVVVTPSLTQLQSFTY